MQTLEEKGLRATRTVRENRIKMSLASCQCNTKGISRILEYLFDRTSLLLSVQWKDNKVVTNDGALLQNGKSMCPNLTCSLHIMHRWSGWWPLCTHMLNAAWKLRMSADNKEADQLELQGKIALIT
nr:unnamed protein product [Callosobruchus analis]